MGQHWDVDEILERRFRRTTSTEWTGHRAAGRRGADEPGSMLRRRRRGRRRPDDPRRTGTAFARSRAAPRRRCAARRSVRQLVKQAKKEGQINTIALPPDWANYGEIMSTFKKRYGLKLTNDNPDGSSAQENQAVRSLKGDSRAPDVLDVSPSFAIAGANEGLYAKYFNSYFGTVPRAMKDGRGFWVGDYWGVISFGVNRAVVSNVPKTWADLLKPEYRNRVALNGSPLTSGSAVAGVFSASTRQRRLADDISPGIDFFKRAEAAGQLHPGRRRPRRRSPRARRRSRSTGTTSTSPTSRSSRPRGSRSPSRRRRVRRVLLPGDQRDAPHPWAARLWQEFLYSDRVSCSG